MIDNKKVMSSVKRTIVERLKVFRRFYYVYREWKILQQDRKQLWKEAVERFNNEQPEHGSLLDYKHALFRHRVSYDEYMKYFEFWRLNEKRREEYISAKEIRCIYRKTVQLSFDILCQDKALLYTKFHNYVYRKWAYSGLSVDVLKNMVASTDCVGKPVHGSLGLGVFLIRKDENHNWQELYDFCCQKNILVEECVRACKEMEEFHPQSLNTLRVYTISKDDHCEILAAEFRVGVGDSIVDNASAGGIVAAIDLDTGTIIGDGEDKVGNKYPVHPNSGKAFKGFVIPYWNNVVTVCKELSTVVPEIVFAGWDICVLQNGVIEMVEVNSYPHVTGLQIAYHKGLKPEFRTLGKKVLGYDPVKLISVWSKCYVKYESIYGRC